MSEECRVYTIQTTAAILGVCTRTVTRMIEEEKLPYVTVGDRKMILKKDIEELLTPRKGIDK